MKEYLLGIKYSFSLKDIPIFHVICTKLRRSFQETSWNRYRPVK